MAPTHIKDMLAVGIPQAPELQAVMQDSKSEEIIRTMETSTDPKILLKMFGMGQCPF